VPADAAWRRYDPAARRHTLTLHVQPNARRSEVVGLHGEALKLRVAAPPAENRANAELIRFLSETLGVPKTAIIIRHGGSGRRKVVEISAGPELAARLGGLT
jgi:uncharacterized protein (TIGR00251 family)